MTLRQLHVLRAVAARGSLSEAARSLGRSQPAVSMQMKALAAELGVELARAGPRGVELTEAGEVLAQYAERILALVDDAAAAARLGRRQAAVLRVAASSTPGVHLLPGLLGRFRRRSPHTRIRLEVTNSEEVEQRVLTGGAEFGVVGGRRTLADLAAEPWCEDELVLIVPSDHALARRRRAPGPAELQEETLLLREAGSATRATIEAAFLRARAPLPGVDVVGSTDAILSAVAAGLGVGIVSRFAVAGPRLPAGLAVRRIAGLELRRPLLLLVHPGRALPAAARELLEFLRRARLPAGAARKS